MGPSSADGHNGYEAVNYAGEYAYKCSMPVDNLVYVTISLFAGMLVVPSPGYMSCNGLSDISQGLSELLLMLTIFKCVLWSPHRLVV